MSDEPDIVARLRGYVIGCDCDIVARLRGAAISSCDCVKCEAAAEIERLRKERDEARRKCCEAWADGHEEFANNSGECGGEPWTPQRFAKEEGWDCFKENA